MKGFNFIAVICCFWISVVSASLSAPYVDSWLTTAKENNTIGCLSKLDDHKQVITEISVWRFTVAAIYTNIKERIQQAGSLDSLDSLIVERCNQSIDWERKYQTMLEIARVCGNQTDVFTEEEKPIVISRMKRTFCSLILKSAMILASSSECNTNRDLVTGMLKCREDVKLVPNTKLYRMLFPTPEMCKTQTELRNCMVDAVKERCDSSLSGAYESTMKSAPEIVGCDVEPTAATSVNEA